MRGLAVLPYLLPTIIVALTFQWMLDSTVGVFTQGVRLFGYSYIPWGESSGAAMTVVIVLSVQ